MNRGQHGGFLSARVFQKLLGCSYYKAKKILKKLHSTKEEVTLDDLGEAIYEFRKDKANRIDRVFDDITKWV